MYVRRNMNLSRLLFGNMEHLSAPRRSQHPSFMFTSRRIRKIYWENWFNFSETQLYRSVSHPDAENNADSGRVTPLPEVFNLFPMWSSGKMEERFGENATNCRVSNAAQVTRSMVWPSCDSLDFRIGNKMHQMVFKKKIWRFSLGLVKF